MIMTAFKYRLFHTQHTAGSYLNNINVSLTTVDMIIMMAKFIVMTATIHTITAFFMPKKYMSKVETQAIKFKQDFLFYILYTTYDYKIYIVCYI